MLTLRPKHPLIYLSADLIAFNAALVFLFYVFINHKFSKLEWGILSLFILSWFAFEYWRKVQDSKAGNELPKQLFGLIKACVCFTGLVLLFYVFFPFSTPNKATAIGIFIGICTLDVVLNLLVLLLVHRLHVGMGKTKYTLVAGVGPTARKVQDQISKHKINGHTFKGFIDCEKNEEVAIGHDKVVSHLRNMQQYLEENPVDEIVIALPFEQNNKIQEIVSAADYHGIRIKYIPDYQQLFGSRCQLTHYGSIDAINIRQLPLDGRMAAFIKNVFDKMFATVALILLAPVCLALAVLIKLESRGPVFYCPIRIGKGGKPFKVYKFRTMYENDTTLSGILSTQEDDPRITKLGRLLRKYSLDELPQFINVFIGNMSVVGPRPHRRYLNKQLQESVYKYMVRHYIKPGITGWAQINGWRGPTITEEQRKQRTLHDLWYMENWSFWLDLKIIVMTVFSKKVHKTAF